MTPEEPNGGDDDYDDDFDDDYDDDFDDYDNHHNINNDPIVDTRLGHMSNKLLCPPTLFTAVKRISD